MTFGLPWPFSATSEAQPGHSTQSLREADESTRTLTSVLNSFATPGVPPPSARIDPKLKLQVRQPIRLWHLWKYPLVAAKKATEITQDIVVHHIWGPRKKSWGIEMTIINSLMRGAGRHSALVDIGTIRMLMSLGGLVPLPSDALVTPVTFRVRTRQLRGILARFDQLETGTRELSGEWVVGRKTWLRLQNEWKATQSSVKKDFNNRNEKKKELVILYIHGGAYYVSSAAAQRIISIPLAKYTDSRVFSLDYRLAPETVFPGPLHDAVSAYMRLVEDLHIPPENIVVAGDSAGGGLSLALLMYLRDNQYDLPSAAILMSPWVDLTMSCESWDSNAPYDVVPFPAPDDHMNPVVMYLGDSMEQYMTHPYASPLFGDFKGLPPLLIQAGDSEVLRDEITLLAHKASLSGVHVRHELYEDAIHVFQMYPFLDSATRAFMSMRDFVRKVLPQGLQESPKQDLQFEKVLEDEIESESVTMVRGDGVETISGLEHVKERVSEPLPVDSSSDTEEEMIPNRRLSRDYPSWGRRTWNLSSGPEHDSDDDDTEEDNSPTTSCSSPTMPLPRRRAGTLPSNFRRLGSAMSLIVPDTGTTRPTHTRTSSYSSQGSYSPTKPPSRRSGPPPPLTLSNTSLASTDSVAPSPSIRRTSRANSHTDISSLVQSWTSNGPANRTVKYSYS